jgi:hypothetical protein
MHGRFLLIALMLLAMSQAPALAQADELQVLRDRIYDLFSEGDGQGAVDAAREALEAADGKLGPHRAKVGEWLAEMAFAQIRRDELALAEPMVKGAVAIMEKAHGPDHPSFADFETPAGQIQIMAELEEEGRTLRLIGMHIQGATANAIGIANLRVLADAVMEKMDYDAVEVEGAVGTTGAGPGRRAEGTPPA